MSETTQDNDDLKPTPEQELAALKKRADMMQLKYHPSIGLEALREKVNAALAETKQPAEDDAAKAAPKAPAAAAPVEELTPEQAERIKLRLMKQEMTKLVRIRLTCMNPNKRELDGEIFTVGNQLTGTIKKFVPFNMGDDGWHVPHIMYEMLRDRQCQIFVPERSAGGVTIMRSKSIKEFAIEVLPQLTQDELDELARRQAMAGSTN